MLNAVHVLLVSLMLQVSKVVGDELACECPYCGKPDHLYLNLEKLAFKCQRCGESGNHIELAAHLVETHLDPINQEQLEILADHRRLPTEAFESHDIRWSPKRKSYVITVRNFLGRPVDIRSLNSLKIKEGFRSAPRAKTCLYGADQLKDTDRKDELVVLVEGNHDKIALDYVLKKAGVSAIVLAVPGAGTFKKEWATWLKGRDVVVIYDHDTAGFNGELKVRATLKSITKSLRFHRWEEDRPDGFDVNDLVSALLPRKVKKRAAKKKRSAKKPNRVTEKAHPAPLIDGGGADDTSITDACKAIWQSIQGRLKDEPKQYDPDAPDAIDEGHSEERYAHMELVDEIIGELGLVRCVGNVIESYGIEQAGLWRRVADGRIARIIMERLGNRTSTARIKDVLQLLRYKVEVKPEDCLSNRTTICVFNGVVNPETGKLLPHDPKYNHRTQLPFAYDPEAETPLWTQTLDEIFPARADCIRLLRMIFGYCLTTDTRLQVFFLWIGSGANGKGVVQSILTALVGEQNVCAIPPAHFHKDFIMVTTRDKLLNIVSEAGTDRPLSTNTLKAVTGQDARTFDKKNCDPETFVSITKHIFAMNEMPVFKDGSYGLRRRAVILPFDRQFAEHERDPDRVNKLLLELPGIFNWALEGLRDLRESGKLVKPAVSIEMEKEFARTQNPVMAFVDEACDLKPDSRIKRSKLYACYRRWHVEAGVRGYPMPRAAMYRQLRSTFKDIDDLKTNSGQDYFVGIDCSYVVDPHAEDRKDFLDRAEAAGVLKRGKVSYPRKDVAAVWERALAKYRAQAKNN